MLPGGCCVEARRDAQRQLDASQGIGDRLRERQCQGGGRHLAATPDEHIVGKNAAQSIQGRAHRRLAQPDALARPRGVALRHQSIEHQQQIQIDGSQIHAVNYWHINIRFPNSRRLPSTFQPLAHHLRAYLQVFSAVH
jgi:hypothetical protein